MYRPPDIDPRNASRKRASKQIRDQMNKRHLTAISATKKAERIERVVIAEQTTGDDLAYDSDDGKPDYINGF